MIANLRSLEKKTDEYDASGSCHKSGNECVAWLEKTNTKYADASYLNHSVGELHHCFEVHDLNNAPLTTFTKGFDGTLDWLLSSAESLKIVKTWGGFAIGSSPLPNDSFPSDHVPVHATYRFTV